MGEDHFEEARIDRRLTDALRSSNAALDRLRPGRPVGEVTDEDILAGRAELHRAVTTLAELVRERATHPGQSGSETDELLLVYLHQTSDIRLFTGEIPQSPERRSGMVTLLQWLAAAVAAALVGLFLQTVADALGVTAALEHATVLGAEWIQGLGDQLKETLPTLVTPALLGTSLILLREAGELSAQLLDSGLSYQRDTAVTKTSVYGMEPRWQQVSGPVSAEPYEGPAAMFPRGEGGIVSAPVPDEDNGVVVQRNVPAGTDPSEPPGGPLGEPPRDAR